MAKEETNESTASGSEPLRGITKAAVLMVALEKDPSAKILQRLDDDIVEELAREIAQLDMLEPAVRNEVIEEFYNLALANQYAKQGGISYARSLLEKAMAPESVRKIMRGLERTVLKRPFAFLSRTDPENLLTFIQDEHPQTIALILSHLVANKSSEILSGLSSQKQLEVVTRIANMDNTNPEVVKEVEKGLEMRLSGLVSQTFQKAGGVEAVAEILNLSDRSTEKGIMEALEAQDPDLVEQIRRLMFVFEDILLVNDKGIQLVLKEIENEELSLALKTASPDLRDKIFRNMSERASELIKEDMEYMGPVRVSDVENAQQKIVDVVRRLEDAGELIISGRGGEKEMIV
ncbi:MAG: flagellar motor switch protein FliG [Planctomycetes bacterium]|nr:flagellar motor switch protein FliG [Planctomycetota bacterium]